MSIKTKLNDNFSSIKESYLFSDIAKKVSAYQKENPDKEIIRLGIGDVTLPLSPAVISAMQKAVGEMGQKETFRGYAPEYGYDFLREAIARYYEKFEVKLSPDEIFVSDGAKSDCGNITDIFGDNPVLIPDPVYPVYLDSNVMSGRKVTFLSANEENDFLPLPPSTEESYIVYLCSPNNPTGVVYSRQTLEGLAELLRRKSTQFGHPIYLIADEPYRELVYDGVEVPFLPTIYPNTLVCYSYSKSLSLPGERIGYVCVPSCVEGQADVLHAVAGAARSSGHVCPPTLVQLALQRCADARPDLAAYDANRRLLYRELTQMGYECIPPQGAFYLFVRVPDGDDVAFSQRAKLEHDLLVVPSTAFHCPGFLRLSYCVSHDMILRSLPAFRAIREKYQ